MDEAKPSNNFTDFNGNSSELTKKLVEDEVETSDGRIFFRCIYCNKVFPQKKSRTSHMKKCEAKDYILTVDTELKPSKVEEEEDKVSEPVIKRIIIQQNIPLIQTPISPKIDIKQNIILNPVLPAPESAILKEKNEDIKKDCLKSEEKVDVEGEELDEEELLAEKCSTETLCSECNQDFRSPLELLRHSRKNHTYPKVVMAMSEVKKFYSSIDRSKCPICSKPIKTKFRSAYIKHLRTHTKETEFSCHICNKKFRRHDHMKAHEKRHILG